MDVASSNTSIILVLQPVLLYQMTYPVFCRISDSHSFSNTNQGVGDNFIIKTLIVPACPINVRYNSSLLSKMHSLGKLENPPYSRNRKRKLINVKMNEAIWNSCD